MNRNQSQLIRKMAPRIGQKKDIWEHAIPSSFFVNELLGMIKENDISDLPLLIDIYSEAGQRALTKEQDLLLYKHKSSMPDYWDWKKSNANPLERHIIVGINSEIL